MANVEAKYLSEVNKLIYEAVGEILNTFNFCTQKQDGLQKSSINTISFLQNLLTLFNISIFGKVMVSMSIVTTVYVVFLPLFLIFCVYPL